MVPTLAVTTDILGSHGPPDPLCSPSLVAHSAQGGWEASRTLPAEAEVQGASAERPFHAASCSPSPRVPWGLRKRSSHLHVWVSVLIYFAEMGPGWAWLWSFEIFKLKYKSLRSGETLSNSELQNSGAQTPCRMGFITVTEDGNVTGSLLICERGLSPVPLRLCHSPCALILRTSSPGPVGVGGFASCEVSSRTPLNQPLAQWPAPPPPPVRCVAASTRRGTCTT